MSKCSPKIQLMRDQQLTQGMKAAAILGLFAVLSSLSRVFAIGWHRIMLVHIVVYLIVLGIVLFKSRISYCFRAFAIVIIPFLLGVAALTSWGLMAFGLVSLYSFCILATILFGTREGLVASIISMATIAIIGGCVHAGIIVFRFNFEQFLDSPTSWLNAVLMMALSAGIIVFTLGTAHAQVAELVDTLERQNDELLKSNLLLRSEIAKRIQAEEDRRKYENKLRDAEKMEAIGALAGGVAHDLNNILGCIVGYPDLLLEELPAQSPLRETIEIIKKSGIKAAAIVYDMLTLARRRIELSDVISLNSVVSEYCTSPEFETLKQFHPLVEVEISTDPALMNIRGSLFHLSRVIMNLVSNAAEAIPGGGRIVISTKSHTIGNLKGRWEEIKEGSYAILSVEDTGTGIPGEDLEKIFEPFYSKKKLGRSGTGLGMAVVWGSVKDHNGYIDVSSVEGKGTKFTLYFPSTEEQMAPVKSPDLRADLRGQGESIVIVDDVQEQREIISRILRDLGYSVRAFSSGEEAVEYFRRASADLLILDMLMEPGIDGLETYRRIAKLHPGQRAIITTGFAETARLSEALKSGVGRYLKKPFLVDEISLAVRAELEKRLSGQNESSPGLWN